MNKTHKPLQENRAEVKSVLTNPVGALYYLFKLEFLCAIYSAFSAKTLSLTESTAP